MKYSVPSTDNVAASAPAHHLVGEGGIVTTIPSDRDPYEILDELMVVVEALCPQWPPRGTFVGNCRL